MLTQDYLNSPEVTALAHSSQQAYGYSMKHLEKFWANVCADGTQTQTGLLHDFQGRMPELAKYLEAKGLSGKSVQQNLTNIKIFLKWAGHPVDYTYKIKSKDKKANKLKHLNRWFSENDVAKCLAYEWPNHSSRHRYRLLVRLLVETGCRVKELANINVEDIDLEDMTIYIQDSKTVPRPVFFSPETRDLIIKLKESRLFIQNVFPDVNRVKKLITDMLKDLGLKNGSDGRGPHTFRHFRATQLFYDGNMRLQDIAFLLGDTEDTIKLKYLHPTPLMLRNRVAKAMRWEY